MIGQKTSSVRPSPRRPRHGSPCRGDPAAGHGAGLTTMSGRCARCCCLRVPRGRSQQCEPPGGGERANGRGLSRRRAYAWRRRGVTRDERTLGAMRPSRLAFLPLVTVASQALVFTRGWRYTTLCGRVPARARIDRDLLCSFPWGKSADEQPYAIGFSDRLQRSFRLQVHRAASSMILSRPVLQGLGLRPGGPPHAPFSPAPEPIAQPSQPCWRFALPRLRRACHGGGTGCNKGGRTRACGGKNLRRHGPARAAAAGRPPPGRGWSPRRPQRRPAEDAVGCRARWAGGYYVPAARPPAASPSARLQGAKHARCCTRTRRRRPSGWPAPSAGRQRQPAGSALSPVACGGARTHSASARPSDPLENIGEQQRSAVRGQPLPPPGAHALDTRGGGRRRRWPAATCSRGSMATQPTGRPARPSLASAALTSAGP